MSGRKLYAGKNCMNAAVKREKMLRDAILDMKMSATNALAEAWLPNPRPSKEEAYDFLIEAMKIIQHRGTEILSSMAAKSS